MSTGTLYLIPCTLGEDAEPADTIPGLVLTVANTLSNFIVEKERTARRFLKRLGYTHSLDDLQLFPLNKHTEPREFQSFIKPLVNGTNMGLLSEAGCPAVADPGSQIVALAHKNGIRVVPLTGPSSLLLALMASGMNGQSFAFHGYLPREQHKRIARIKELERAAQKGQTQLFIEAPYRNDQLLKDILNSCMPRTRLCIAADITLESELIVTREVSDWRGKPPGLHKRPVVFLLAGSS